MSEEEKGADVVKFEAPKHGPEYWVTKMTQLAKKAEAEGKEGMKAFLGAYVAIMPGVLEQLGSRDLAAAVRVRFFEPAKPPTIPEVPADDAN